MTSLAKPRMLWQGTLLLLPVLVLAAFGLYSLRQDRLLVYHDAQEGARDLARDLAGQAWNSLTTIDSNSEGDSEGIYRLTLSVEGNLVHPRPYSRTPEPRVLSGPIEFSWGGGVLDQLEQPGRALQELDAGTHSPELAANAAYQLGNALKQADRKADARLAFQLVLDRFPEGTTESGIPLLPLASLGLLELETGPEETPQSSAQLTDRLRHLATLTCSNALASPSLVTPLILNKAAEVVAPWDSAFTGLWQQRWQSEEKAREIFADARQYLKAQLGTGSPWNAVHWVALRTPNEDQVTPRQLALVLPQTRDSGAGTNLPQYLIYPESILQGRISSPKPDQAAGLASVLHQSTHGLNQRFRGLRIPSYVGIRFVVAGRDILSLPSTTADRKPNRDEPLASHAVVRDGKEILKVHLDLIHPEILFNRQSQRTMLFSLLIGVSALTAVIGFVASRRALWKQQRLADMKSNFVSSVSHELRAPIASVRLMAENLDQGKITERGRQEEYFHFIVRECERLSSMIENVLHFSRIEQGRREYQFTQGDVNKVVTDTITLLTPYAGERRIRLELGAAEPPIPSFDMDSQALQQALINLIDNAIKHSPEGDTVRIHVRKLRDELELTVEDHGPGIPEEDQKRIFERFYRRGSELQRETKGVGIGLTIVKHVIEAHQGSVRVESRTGHGCRFHVTLPMKRKGTQATPTS